MSLIPFISNFLYHFCQILLSAMDAGYSYSCQEVKYNDDPKELRVRFTLFFPSSTNFYLTIRQCMHENNSELLLFCINAGCCCLVVVLLLKDHWVSRHCECIEMFIFLVPFSPKFLPSFLSSLFSCFLIFFSVSFQWFFFSVLFHCKKEEQSNIIPACLPPFKYGYLMVDWDQVGSWWTV